ncbi:cysteine hydrolase family protein [Mycolicibacterium fortuitum]|uniref:cysteine hydrolase family protein n=1 Tax=Mycolicibacterium fortuitum TaxID=1766 RepID=UPI0033B08010
MDGAAAVEGTAERLDRIASLIRAFRAAARPVVHVVRLYRPGGSDVDSVRRASIEAGEHVVAPDTEGAQIPAELLGSDCGLMPRNCLRANSSQSVRTRRSSTNLAGRRSSARVLMNICAAVGVTTVAVAGCNLPNCPRATLFDASERDYRTVLVTDATSQGTVQRLADLELLGSSSCRWPRCRLLCRRSLASYDSEEPPQFTAGRTSKSLAT